MKVYYGLDRKSLVSSVKYPMISFRSLRKRNSPIVDNGANWFMDSGAFTYLKNDGIFPFTYGEYLGVVSHFKPNLWSCMDWCCEPSVLQRTRHTVDTHIALTIENGIQLIDFDKNSFVMVIQGWDQKDYISCCDKIKEQGLITKVMGIGTICGRTNIREVFDILKSIKFELPDWCKIHCFGMSINLLKYKEIYDRVDSTDTYAWAREFGANKPLLNALVDSVGKHNAEVKVLLDYQKKVEKIINKNEKQSLLKITE